MRTQITQMMQVFMDFIRLNPVNLCYLRSYQNTSFINC